MDSIMSRGSDVQILARPYELNMSFFASNLLAPALSTAPVPGFIPHTTYMTLRQTVDVNERIP